MRRCLKGLKREVLKENGYLILFSSLLVPEKLGVFLIIAYVLYTFFSKVNLHNITLTQISIPLLMLSFFFINALSLIWSDNPIKGIKEIESIASFFLFPTLIILFRKRKTNYYKVAYFFSKALNLVLIACIGIALYNALKYVGFQHWPFKYYNFTYWVGFHPGYLSLLLLISLVNMAFIYAKTKNKWIFVSFVFQSSMLFFIGAKYSLGLFLFDIVLLMILFRNIIKTKILLGVLGVVLSALFSLSLSINTYDRILNFRDAFIKRGELNKSAIVLAQDRIWLGYGAGGVDGRLIESYKNNNNEEAYVKKYNAHNQYIQTLLTTGLIGLFILIAIILVAIKTSQNRRLCFILMLQFAIFFTVESALERQKGIVTFVIWTLFVVVYSSKQNNLEGIDTKFNENS